MSLVIFLLGSLQMTLDEAPLAGFSTDKERALLLYLALERQHPHRRESLAALFWEEQPQQLAFNNLRKTLHRLRQTLQENGRPQPCLLITAKEVQWNPAADIRLDVEEFVKLINRSHNHQHRRAATCQSCRAGMTRAAAHNRGNFLDQIWLADLAAFEEWTARCRDRLRSQSLYLIGQ
jgi:DNA-binding SARP family transcriptional activator